MSPEPTIPTTSRVLEALQALPVGTHLAIGGGLVAGLMLWVFGRKVMKPAFAVVGMVVGGLIGLLLTPAAGIPAIGPAEPPYVGLAIGAALGLGVAAVLFRFLMAAAAGIVLAVAGVLAAGVWIDSRPAEGGGPAPSAAIVEHLAQPSEPEQERPAENPDPAPGEATLEQAAQTLVERTRAFVQAASARAREAWAATSGRDRAILIGGGVVGAIAGVLAGLALPKRAAAIVSAPLGASIWLPSAAWLAHAIATPGIEHLPRTPLRWLVVWLVVSGVGIALQLVGMKRGSKGEK